MAKTSDVHAGQDLLGSPRTTRAMAGAVTWLLLVVIPWLAVAVMYSLLVFPLLPIAVLTGLGYVIVTMPARRTLPHILGAVVVVAGAIWTEWAALTTADHVARTVVAASRGRVLDLGVTGPMTSSLIGVALFYIGMKVINPDRSAFSALWPTLAVALICPVVAVLVQLNLLPLSA